MQQDEYLKLAEVEDEMWYFRSLHGHVRRELEAAGLPARARILDAGCGTGGLSLRLSTAHPEWNLSAIDFSALACDLARRRCGPAVDVRQASITALPFADETFDAVMPVDVISQVDDAVGAINECFRVAKRGALVIVNVPAYMWMWSYHDDACQTKYRYTRAEIRALLRQAGFREPRITHWNSLTFPAIWAKRRFFRTPADTSDVKRYPLPIEAGFSAAMGIEHAVIEMGGQWPWGSSIFAVARKP
jgi:ubiquinone/menaquinone biosynthesis C-methylase UbiE